MKQNKIFVLSFILLLCLSTVSALTYYFPANNNFLNINSNNSYIGIGNFNNTHILVSNINGTVDKININTLANDGKLSNVGLCNSSTSSSKHIVMKLLDNSTICSEQTALLGYNSVGTLIYSTSNVGLIGIGVTKYNSSQYYAYYISSGGFNRVSTSSLSTLGFNCLATFNNTMFNNYGITVNSLTASNFFAEDDFDRFFFKFGNRYFFINESATSNISSCNNMVVEEAFITTTNVSSTDTNIIMNDALFINTKNSNNRTNLYTSSNVDIYTGLVCDNLGGCYKQNSVCFPDVDVISSDLEQECYQNLYSCEEANSNICGLNLYSIFWNTLYNPSKVVCEVCFNELSVCLGKSVTLQDYISSRYLSLNNAVINNDLYADIGNLSFCSGGCNNTIKNNIYGVEYIEGSCNVNATCLNDCVVEGLRYPSTSTSYKQCGFYDSDTCLDWSSSIPCADGEYSNSEGLCETLNTTGYTFYGLRSFITTPNLQISNGYNLNTLPPSVTYTSKATSLILGVDYQANPTSFYISKTCEYNTTTLKKSETPLTINTSETILLPSYTNGDSIFTFKLVNNGSVKIQGVDAVNTPIYEYNITYNDTHGICLYDNQSLLGCEAVSFIDISDVEFTVKTTRPQTKQLHATRTIIHKTNGGFQDIYTSVRTPITDPVGTLGKVIISSNDVTLNKLNIYNEIQVNNAYKNTTWTQIVNGEIQYQHNCIYTGVGIYTLRSYYADNLLEGYWNYKDWTITISSLGGMSIQTDDSNSLFNNLTKTTKILMSFLISFLIAIILLVLGLIDKNEQQGNYFKYLAVFLFFGGIIVFGILGWLPVWVIISCFLLSASVVGFFIINKSQGG